MILHLLKYLQLHYGFSVPTVLSYVSTRMILAALTTLILTIFLGPFFIKKLYSLKIGQHIRGNDICPVLAKLHSTKKDTPTMGGILILVSMLISMILWMDLTSIFTLILAVTTIWLGAIGAIDDFLKLKYKSSKGLSAKLKAILQLIFAIFISLYLLSPAVTSIVETKKMFKPPTVKEFKENYTRKTKSLTLKEYSTKLFIPFIKKPIVFPKNIGPIIFLFFFIFIIMGSSNAVNLTDGLDGLASGLLVLVASVFALVSFLSNNFEFSKYLHLMYIEGSGEIAIYLFALIGAALGFLWYNGYPAQVFMGDTGSLALGGIIGVVAILLKREILLALVGGIFVVEALSVILQVWSYRYRDKKRIFLCAPLHHHYEYKGWPEMKVVLRFWIIGLLLAIIGIASLKIQ